MSEPRSLLHRLLDYIGEQAKDIDPRGFRLSAVKGFIRRPADIAGLPGIETDLKVAGDHIWLRIPRLVASKPRAVSENFKGLIRVSDDPNGPLPLADEAAFLHRLHKASEGKPEAERKDLEARGRIALAKAVEAYTVLWQSWAEGERPRRKTITLYADLFTLKQQLEAEETVKPQEFVWGIGVAGWKLKFEGSSFDFDYPVSPGPRATLQDRP